MGNDNSPIRKGLRDIDPTNKNSALTKAVSKAVQIPIQIANKSTSTIYVKLTGEGSNEYYRIDPFKHEAWNRRLGKIDVYVNTKAPSNFGAFCLPINNGTPGTNVYEWDGRKLERQDARNNRFLDTD